MKSSLILILNSFIIFHCFTQSNKSFQFPLNKNKQNFLSGTMGELRGDHFHMGIDIKTNGKIGIPIHASKSGYVERIRIGTSGYGRALYMNHNDGTKTVYAHLSKFNNSIEKFITKEQYKIQSFEITRYPEKNKFQFNKGELIGYSGNTGSSSGPHLHFEIRDSNDDVLDPLSYNFIEIKDTVNPTFEKVIFKTLDINSRINGGFGYYEYSLVKRKNKYYLDGKVSMKGNIGIAIYGYDRLDVMPNKNGIKKIEMFFNKTKLVSNNIEKLSYSETSKIVKYIDYNLYNKKRKQYIKLYQDDGNKILVHRNNSHNGIININNDSTHFFQIYITDSYNNSSELNFYSNNKNDEVDNSKKIIFNNSNVSIIDNVLELTLGLNHKDYIEILYENNLIKNQFYTYKTKNSKVFLLDLKKILPQKIITEDKEINTQFISSIYPNLEKQITHKDFELLSYKNTLFDTLYIRFEKKYDSTNNLELFSFSNKNDIANKSFSIKLKTLKNYDLEKSHVYSVSKDDYYFIGGDWKNNLIEFKSKLLSDFTILTDTIPPEIKSIKTTKDELRFKIRDDLSGIKEYIGKINGNWILFNYDYKRDLIFSQKIDKEKPFIGNFELKIIDKAGNINMLNFKL